MRISKIFPCEKMLLRYATDKTPKVIFYANILWKLGNGCKHDKYFHWNKTFWRPDWRYLSEKPGRAGIAGVTYSPGSSFHLLAVLGRTSGYSLKSLTEEKPPGLTRSPTMANSSNSHCYRVSEFMSTNGDHRLISVHAVDFKSWH